MSFTEIDFINSHFFILFFIVVGTSQMMSKTVQRSLLSIFCQNVGNLILGYQDAMFIGFCKAGN